MDLRTLRQAVNSIELSGAARARIQEACRSKLTQTRKESIMKTRTPRRFAIIAAVLALCICLSIGGMAATHTGFFKDVTNHTGAVTGTVYEHADNEIAISATADSGTLTVSVTLLSPDIFPYREIEVFAIGSYRIVDAQGKTIANGTETDFAEAVNDQILLTIPLDGVESGTYCLEIDAFVGSKKADQPLQIKGSWDCPFSIF